MEGGALRPPAPKAGALTGLRYAPKNDRLHRKLPKNGPMAVRAGFEPAVRGFSHSPTSPFGWILC